MGAGDKKVRTRARPDEKTLPEPTNVPTVPDGEAARVARKRRQEREAVPRAPLDIYDHDAPRKRR